MRRGSSDTDGDGDSDNRSDKTVAQSGDPTHHILRHCYMAHHQLSKASIPVTGCTLCPCHSGHTVLWEGIQLDNGAHENFVQRYTALRLGFPIRKAKIPVAIAHVHDQPILHNEQIQLPLTMSLFEVRLPAWVDDTEDGPDLVLGQDAFRRFAIEVRAPESVTGVQ